MSNLSRKEIIELYEQARGLVDQGIKNLGGNLTCPAIADIGDRLSSMQGVPSVKDRELGRLLKSWIESSRGQRFDASHPRLLAMWQLHKDGLVLELAIKRSRAAVKAAETDKSHWLYKLTNSFLHPRTSAH